MRFVTLLILAIIMGMVFGFKAFVITLAVPFLIFISVTAILMVVALLFGVATHRACV